MRRNILLTGATGKQGTALIRALIVPYPISTLTSPPSSSPPPASDPVEYHIYAVTRNPSSPSAQHILALDGGRGRIHLVQGELDDVESVRRVFEDVRTEDAGGGGGIWGVFAVLAFPGLGKVADGEERQGKFLADLALEFNVQAFIYSSAMRAGPKYEHELKLSGRAKANVEEHCIELGKKGLNWVILRPGFFMENWDDFIGSIAVAVLKKGLKEDTTMGVIGSEDIGHVAAEVFQNHTQYIHKILIVVSEFATMKQIEEAHVRATGKPIPSVPGIFGWAVVQMNAATQELIKSIELNHRARTSGEYPTHETEVALANEAYKMRAYEEWVRAAPKRKEGGGKESWNQVSLWKLLLGRS